jgi:Trk K+ transport system NAD-binding subunit
VKDRKIQDLRFPKNAIIGCIVRGRRVLPAPGYEQLLAGDRVVVLSRPNAMPEVEDLFSGKSRGLFS